jgi:plasmid maintenance system antidote protein VapI
MTFKIDDFSNFLRKNRIKKKKFAEDIGYNYSHIIQIFNGKKPLTERIIKAMENYKSLIEAEIDLHNKNLQA